MRYELNFDEDKVNDVLDKSGASYDLKGCCELLNEQQDKITELEKNFDDLVKWASEIAKRNVVLDEQIGELQRENKQLRQMIKENVFQQYREGSLADLEFKAIAYDDIIKVKLSDESEPKVIVVCKQGKKENVKSFCQMFIPFGVYYEIKEVIE